MPNTEIAKTEGNREILDAAIYVCYSCGGRVGAAPAIPGMFPPFNIQCPFCDRDMTLIRRGTIVI